jgi:hypothetical protein
MLIFYLQRIKTNLSTKVLRLVMFRGVLYQRFAVQLLNNNPLGLILVPNTCIFEQATNPRLRNPLHCAMSTCHHATSKPTQSHA